MAAASGLAYVLRPVQAQLRLHVAALQLMRCAAGPDMFLFRTQLGAAAA